MKEYAFVEKFLIDECEKNVKKKCTSMHIFYHSNTSNIIRCWAVFVSVPESWGLIIWASETHNYEMLCK